jgi:signal transduction histidine kinase
MLHVLGCITDQHDLRLVVLAGLLCAFASWTAVSLLLRASVSAGRVRLAWTLAAGGVFGAGVWGTHFIAMLAYQSQFFIGYGVLLTAASIVIAATFSAIGFAFVLRGLAIAGGVVVGLAISGMHYVGMAALEGPFDLAWDWTYVVASVLVSILFAALATFVGTNIANMRGRIGAAALLTLGICGLHFTAMAAVVLNPNPAREVAHAMLQPGMLALTIAAVAILIVSLGLVSAALDSHLTLRRSDEERRLRAYITALEAARAEQDRTSEDLRAALARAAAASSAKSSFLAAMSHELRTPLNAIIGFSDLLLSGAADTARHDEYVGDIRDSGQRLLQMINAILDLARLDAGQLKLNATRLSLKALLEDVVAAASPAARDSGVVLKADFAAALPPLDADAQLLARAFGNLLSNAIKFTPAGGSVQVSARANGASLVVAIEDSGIGIADDDIPRALERFAQVDGHLARSYEGAGLGLPLARDFIVLHGGTLDIASEVGTGTTVTVTLPAAHVQAEALAAE